MTSPRSAVDTQPRTTLGHWPTPLEPLDRLRAELTDGTGLTAGSRPPRLWIKRDDCSGLATGGNKTRKLEFLLGRAVAEGAEGVVTFGALQSNHARQTAAACARLGLGCDLILTRAVDRSDEHYLHAGNVLLDRVLGAQLHLVDDPDAAFVRFAELFADAERDARQLFGIGPGGSEPVGVLGYVAAAVELGEQLQASDAAVGRIVVAASTAGTAAGLILGCALAGIDAVVDVACVYEPASVTGPELASLIDRTAAEFDLALPDANRWRVTDATLGPGYGLPTAEAFAAIELLARTEGILLDPVYTAKAFAHLLATLADPQPEAKAPGTGSDRGDVLFIHTGGSAGLHAYAAELESALTPPGS